MRRGQAGHAASDRQRRSVINPEFAGCLHIQVQAPKIGMIALARIASMVGARVDMNDCGRRVEMERKGEMRHVLPRCIRGAMCRPMRPKIRDARTSLIAKKWNVGAEQTPGKGVLYQIRILDKGKPCWTGNCYILIRRELLKKITIAIGG
jgi:hypothetical protein